MKVRYLGDPNERAAGIAASNPLLNAYGRTFMGPYFDRAAEVVDISDLPLWQQEKIARNPHFEVVEALPEGTVIDEGDPDEDTATAAHVARAKSRRKD